MGKFVVSTRSNGEYQFVLKAGNGEVILTSEGYSSKANCHHGIESVRKNAPDVDQYDRKHSANGKQYFNLKAANGQVIGTSQLYESASGVSSGIASVQHNAPDATVEEPAAV
nr:YegP family protein [Paraflavitalea sp. H1-2-19X]